MNIDYLETKLQQLSKKELFIYKRITIFTEVKNFAPFVKIELNGFHINVHWISLYSDNDNFLFIL